MVTVGACLLPGRLRRMASAGACVLSTLFPLQVLAHPDGPWAVHAGGGTVTSLATPAAGGEWLVSVSLPETADGRFELRRGDKRLAARLAGSDSVSKLAFLVPEQPLPASGDRWAPAAGTSVARTLSARGTDGPRAGQGEGWVKLVRGKVLPFALFKARFESPAPGPGAPLFNEAGTIVGVVFQATGTGGSVYAIPAEAVQRVLRDVRRDGRLARGWIGVSLQASTTVPQIVRVWPDSPAARAGIRPDDVILRIGSRHLSDYADAVNAFFYLVPEEPVRVKLLRGVDQLEFSLVPTHARPD